MASATIKRRERERALIQEVARNERPHLYESEPEPHGRVWEIVQARRAHQFTFTDDDQLAWTGSNPYSLALWRTTMLRWREIRMEQKTTATDRLCWSDLTEITGEKDDED